MDTDVEEEAAEDGWCGVIEDVRLWLEAAVREAMILCIRFKCRSMFLCRGSQNGIVGYVGHLSKSDVQEEDGHEGQLSDPIHSGQSITCSSKQVDTRHDATAHPITRPHASHGDL